VFSARFPFSSQPLRLALRHVVLFIPNRAGNARRGVLNMILPRGESIHRCALHRKSERERERERVQKVPSREFRRPCKCTRRVFTRRRKIRPERFPLLPAAANLAELLSISPAAACAALYIQCLRESRAEIRARSHRGATLSRSRHSNKTYGRVAAGTSTLGASRIRNAFRRVPRRERERSDLKFLPRFFPRVVTPPGMQREGGEGTSASAIPIA